MNLLLLIRISGFINIKAVGSKQHLLLHILTKKDLNILVTKIGLPRIFFFWIMLPIYFKSSKFFRLLRLAANLRYFENKLQEKICSQKP